MRYRRPIILAALASALALAGCKNQFGDTCSPFEEGQPLGPDWVSTLVERSSKSGVGGFDFADQSPEMVERRAKAAAYYNNK